jgi:hypothetical protein
MTALSVVVFAALSASGDPAVTAPIGPAGPFADLHYRLAPVLIKAACWLAAACGGRPRSTCRTTRNTVGSSSSATTRG